MCHARGKDYVAVRLTMPSLEQVQEAPYSLPNPKYRGEIGENTLQQASYTCPQ
jgi:hypothetical protein